MVKKSIACRNFMSTGKVALLGAIAYLSHRKARILHFLNSPRQAKPMDRDGVLSKLIILIALSKSCQICMLKWPNSESDMLRCNSCITDK